MRIYFTIIAFLLLNSLSAQKANQRLSLKDLITISTYDEMPDIAMGDSKSYVFSYLANITETDNVKKFHAEKWRNHKFKFTTFHSYSYNDSIEVIKVETEHLPWDLIQLGEFVFLNNKLVYIYIENYLSQHLKEKYQSQAFTISDYETKKDSEITINILPELIISKYPCYSSGCSFIEIIDRAKLHLLDSYKEHHWYFGGERSLKQSIRNTFWSKEDFRKGAHIIYLNEIEVSEKVKAVDKLFYSGEIKQAKEQYKKLLNDYSFTEKEYVNEQLKKLYHTKRVWMNTELGKAIKGEISFDDILFLNVANKNIYCIPKEITAASNLVKLNVSGNTALRAFPDDFDHLNKLKTFNIGETGFKRFPSELVYLNQIQELNCDNNPQLMEGLFKVLPVFYKLERLSLVDNSLNFLPGNLTKLSNLKKISTRGNSISSSHTNKLLERGIKIE